MTIRKCHRWIRFSIWYGYIRQLILISSNFRNMFPENIIQATFQRVHTKYVAEKSPMLKRIPNITLEIFLKKQQQKLEHIMRKKIEYDNGVNVLGMMWFYLTYVPIKYNYCRRYYCVLHRFRYDYQQVGWSRSTDGQIFYNSRFGYYAICCVTDVVCDNKILPNILSKF
jgi:hypothetical protein